MTTNKETTMKSFTYPDFSTPDSIETTFGPVEIEPVNKYSDASYYTFLALAKVDTFETVVVCADTIELALDKVVTLNDAELIFLKR